MFLGARSQALLLRSAVECSTVELRNATAEPSDASAGTVVLYQTDIEENGARVETGTIG